VSASVSANLRTLNNYVMLILALQLIYPGFFIVEQFFVHRWSYSLCKDNRLQIKSTTCYLLCMHKIHVYHIFYILEHSGMCHLSISPGISISLFQLSFISHVQRTDMIVVQLLNGKGVYNRLWAFQLCTIQALMQCHVSSQVFTTRYALNACHSIEESFLLKKKSRANVTLPLSCAVYTCPEWI